MLDIKMTKEELLIFHDNLVLVTNLKGTKFAYAIARNLSLIKDEVEALQKVVIPTEDFLEYERERIQSNEKYAVKHNGQPQKYMKDDREQFFIGDQAGFDTAILILREKYKDALDNRQKQIKELEVLLVEDVFFTFREIEENDFPEGITAKELIGISRIIKGF